jgi:hypothetical protein
MERESYEATCSIRIGSSSPPGYSLLLKKYVTTVLPSIVGERDGSEREGQRKLLVSSGTPQHTPENRDFEGGEKGENTRGPKSDHAASKSLHSKGP